MVSSGQESAYIFLHLVAQSKEWEAIIPQFALIETARRGRGYAAWACDRLTRAIASSEGIVALNQQGELSGLIVFEITDDAVEISFPWCREYLPELLEEITRALIQILDEYPHCPQQRRAERPITPGDADPYGLVQSGFICHWRTRMHKDIDTWLQPPQLPAEYRLLPWHARYIDDAAKVIFQANKGTLDALLYAPFFGDSPAQCRKGLLAILAGRYGNIHQQASQIVLAKGEMVGVNLVINEDTELASVVEISVLPAFQRRGLGRALMQQAIFVLTENHYDRVELAVTKDNFPAVHLYQSLGFYSVGDFPVCYWPEK